MTDKPRFIIDKGRGSRLDILWALAYMDAIEQAMRQDEPDVAAWRNCADSTPIKITVSTPAGPPNKFAELFRKSLGHQQYTVEVTPDWMHHPVKSEQLALDSDGKPTSPWFEKQND